MKWTQVLSVLILVYAYGDSAAPQTQNVDWKAVINQLNELVNQIYDFKLGVSLAALVAESLTREVETRIVVNFDASDHELGKVFKVLFSAAKNETLTVSQADTYLGNIKENVDTLWAAVVPEIHMLHPNKTVDLTSSPCGNIKDCIAMASINIPLLLIGSPPKVIISSNDNFSRSSNHN